MNCSYYAIVQANGDIAFLHPLSEKDKGTVLLMQVPQMLKLGGINMSLIFQGQSREMLIALS